MGGQGDDTLNGGFGYDTYLYAVGQGNDIIEETGDFRYPGGVSLSGKVKFIGLSALDLTVVVIDVNESRKDVIITITSTGETLTIKNQINDGYININEFEFEDGTILSWSEFLNNQEFNTVGTVGDDILGAGSSGDTLDGQAGDDLLYGGEGSDTYLFDYGYDDDIIVEKQGTLPASDTIKFGATITQSDVEFSKSSTSDGGQDLIITLKSSGETLRVQDQFGAETPRIEIFEFGDGSSINAADVLTLLHTGTSSSETLIGTTFDDTIDGSSGNDFLRGEEGDDTYIFASGHGSDIVNDNSGSTLLKVPYSATSDVSFALQGRDLLLSSSSSSDEIRIIKFLDSPDNYSIEFNGGAVLSGANILSLITTDTYEGTGGDDYVVLSDLFQTVTLGEGDDIVADGGNAPDYIAFGSGDGNDIIGKLTGTYTVVFADGINPDDISASIKPQLIQEGETNDAEDEPWELSITITSTGDTITLRLENPEDFELSFGDGTLWSAEDLAPLLMQSTDGNDTLSAEVAADFLQTSDAQWYVLDGGAGNDTLFGDGSAESTTYVFGRGYGEDVVVSAYGTNTIQFGDNIVPSDISWEVVFHSSGPALQLTIDGTSDKLTVLNYSQVDRVGNQNQDRIDSFTFADGTSHTMTEFLIAANELGSSTSGNDHIIRSAIEGVLDGGAGDDLLEGGSKADTYIYDIGYGNDTIVAGSSTNDEVHFGSGILTSDVIISFSGYDLVFTMGSTGETLTIKDHLNDASLLDERKVEKFVFDDGTEWLGSDLENTILTQATGQDNLILVDGGTYTFAAGDGNDLFVLSDRGDAGNIITDASIDQNSISILRSSDQDAVALITDSGDSILLGANSVSQITFNDGTIWSYDQAVQNMLNNEASANATEIQGFAGNVTVSGNAQDNDVTLSEGNSYLFSVDGSADTVLGGSKVIFDAGIDESDLAFTIVDNTSGLLDDQGEPIQSLIVEHTASGTTLTVIDYSLYLNFSLNFDDGTVLTDDDIKATQIGTSTNDTLVGNDSDEIFDGVAGDDLYIAGGGEDTILFNVGDGNDQVSFSQGFSDLIVQVEANPDDVSLSLIGWDSELETWDYTLTIDATGDSLTLPFSYKDISIEFLDGSVWSAFDVGMLILPQPVVLDGGASDDTYMSSDYFVDLALYDGSGQDSFINEPIDYQSLAITLGSGITFDDLSITADQSNNTVTVTIDATGDSLTIQTDTPLSEPISITEGGGALPPSGPPNLIDVNQYLQFPSDEDHVFEPNTGNLVLGDDEDISSAHNTLIFGGGLTLGDVNFDPSGSEGEDLLITVITTGETITVEDQFDPYLGVDVSTLNYDERVDIMQSPKGIEFFEFDGGVSLDRSDVAEIVFGPIITPPVPVDLDQDNMLVSDNSGDTLDGGAGADTLSGGTGDDTFLFDAGYAEDQITDSGGTDTLVFGAGISFGDLYFSRIGENGDDLLIEVGGEERLTMTLSGQFSGSDNLVERFEFADGGYVTWEDVQNILLSNAQTSGDDLVVGFVTDDVVEGGNGADTLEGGAGNDLLIGGVGRDIARYSGTAADYIIISHGDHYTVEDNRVGGDGIDTLFGVEDLYFESETSEDSIGNLEPENRGPIANDDGDVSTNEDELIEILASDVLVNDTDPDGDELKVVSVTSQSEGRAWINLNGNISFEPPEHFSGVVTLEYVVEDPDGAEHSAEISINVHEVNDQPSITSASQYGSVTEDDSLNASTIGEVAATDVDGDILTYTDATGAAGAYGTFTVDAGTGAWIYDLDNENADVDALGEGETLTDTFTVEVSDGNGGTATDTVTITINGADDGAVIGEHIVGSSSAETLNGSAGNDTIFGNGGEDTLFGGDGDDIFQYSMHDHQDLIDGGAGIDTVQATEDGVRIHLSGSFDASNGIEVISADGHSGLVLYANNIAANWDFSGIQLDGVTQLRLTSPDDYVIGSSGADTIFGSGGNDTLFGGDGDDVFEYSKHNHRDIVDGGAGVDTIKAIEDGVYIHLTGDFDASNGIEVITADGHSGLVLYANNIAANWDFSGIQLDGVTQLRLTSPDDYVIGSSGADTIFGSGGNDTLFGGDGDDVFEYSKHNHRDLVDGGAGVDTIKAIEDGVTIQLSGTFDTSNGIEVITADGHSGLSLSSNNIAAVWDFSDIQLDGVSEIRLSSPHDHVIGSVGSDMISGSGGNDTLFGGAGNDTIDGGGAHDRISGGSGDDYLTGAAGNDVFLFDDTWGNDTIGDFDPDRDVLDLSSTTLVYSDLIITQVGSDTSIVDGAGNAILLIGVDMSNISEDDFVF